MARDNRDKIETALESIYGCTMYGRFKTFGIKSEDVDRVIEICNTVEGREPKKIRVEFGPYLTSGKDAYEVGGCVFITYNSTVYHKIYITP